MPNGSIVGMGMARSRRKKFIVVVTTLRANQSKAKLLATASHVIARLAAPGPIERDGRHLVAAYELRQGWPSGEHRPLVGLTGDIAEPDAFNLD